jgi:hypothetical protein
VPRPGTAVLWDGALYEVVEAEITASGGFRYTLAPWDERLVVRGTPAAYGAEAPPGPLERPPHARGFRGLPKQVRLLVIGLLPTALLWWFFPVHALGEGMSFFIHESGHTLAAWSLGCFAVPAVIMTLTFDQNRAAAAMVWAGLLFAAWKNRELHGWKVVLATLAALYPIVAFTRLHLDAISLAGHGAEAVGVAILFWRALAGGQFAEWERPVCSMLAWWVWIRNLRLFAGIVFSSEARTDYLTIAITGENDLVTVAKAHGLSLTSLAFVCLLLTLAIPIAALALSWRREETDSTD